MGSGSPGVFAIDYWEIDCYKNKTWFDNDAGWSSLEARRAHNPKVAGSNPAPATKLKQGVTV
jgi:hypothetical protein